MGMTTQCLVRATWFLLSVRHARLKVTALTCLLATAVLALAVAHGSSRTRSAPRPGIAGASVRIASLGQSRRAPRRPMCRRRPRRLYCPQLGQTSIHPCRCLRGVRSCGAARQRACCQASGPADLLRRSHLPLRARHRGCATALAMWLALYPLLGARARIITFVLGVAWTLLMSLAVVGAHWHTPLDAVGSDPPLRRCRHRRRRCLRTGWDSRALHGCIGGLGRGTGEAGSSPASPRPLANGCPDRQDWRHDVAWRSGDPAPARRDLSLPSGFGRAWLQPPRSLRPSTPMRRCSSGLRRKSSRPVRSGSPATLGRDGPDGARP